MKLPGRRPPVITVVIADRNRRLAEIMGQLLDDDFRFQVIGVVFSAQQAEDVARTSSPDVVLVSQHLDGRPGAETCARVRRVAPGASLLLWSHDTGKTVAETPDVDAILARGLTYQELARAIRDVRRGPAAPRPRVVDLNERVGSAV